MADYSGYSDPWSTSFDPNTGPTYWWSSKAYSRLETRVPKDYLGLLIDVFTDASKKWLKKYPESAQRAKITFDPKKQEWVLHGHSLSWDNRKTERYFGWDNPCTHEDKRWNDAKKYYFCMKCSTIICKHEDEKLTKNKGDVDWWCSACGAIVPD